jgi:hypothetical protein
MSEINNPGPSHKLDSSDLLAAARKLWGQETSCHGREMRFGARGSKSIKLDDLVWFDHEAGAGGGIVDLCARAGINGEWRERDVTPRAGARKSDWRPIVPPPADAEKPGLGQLTCDKKFEYFGSNGEILFYVKRFEARSGRAREFYPLTYGELDGVTGWHPKAPLPPIPLYNLDMLHQAGDRAVVLLVEGEKAADAANRKLGEEAAEMVALSWFGGKGRAKDADLSPLTGRKVIIWPDADKAGLEARDDLVKNLPAAHVIDITGLPDGFDAADMKAEEKIGEFIHARMKGPETPAASGQKTETDAEDGTRQPVSREEFFFISPQNNFVWEPSREFWVAAAIDKRLGRKTSTWIAKNRPVDQITWAPGEPSIILDKIVVEHTGWMERPGARVFNQYRAPIPGNGDPGKAGPWLEHVKKLYPDDWEHILAWCAQRVQFPHIKINHALVIGGAMRIGKDVMLQPLMRAVGPGNAKEESPQAILSTFNGYAKAVVLRVNEARDLGESDRFKFYDHMKTLIATPPDTIEVNEKHLRQYHIPNVVGVIITTNHKADGIHLPADDGRHYVAWSQVTRDSFGSEDEHKAYFNELCGWFDMGGLDHAAAYLRTFDLEGFDPKTPPPRTHAFWDIANANRAQEEAELADVIERLGDPAALTVTELKRKAMGDASNPPMTEILNWLNDRKNLRATPHKLERCGYRQVTNPDRPADGLWKVNGARTAIYARVTLSIREQITAARELVRQLQEV